ncbi:MAG: methyltransferase domain-containing protein [Chryseobacterium sp.]|nr:methyltransferase domain-containing protein [Candidatus Chryseobacterium enterohippi]
MTIKEYYNQLAKSYDENRFDNSYGKYIDTQERKFLQNFFQNKLLYQILDLGCGTGRLLKFATHGADFSTEMLEIAKNKHPSKNLKLGEISKIPFENLFDCIFSFHVIMHQTKQETIQFLDECYLKLEDNGYLIFDYPTKARRTVVSEQENWHANNAYTESEIAEITSQQWKTVDTVGILFFPIQRIPKSLRKFFLPIDQLLCRSFMKKWASYQIVILNKR